MIGIYKKMFFLTDRSVEEYKNKSEESIKKLEETQTWLKKLLAQYTLLKKQVFGMIQVKNNQNEY